jgi:hypothetical protein
MCRLFILLLLGVDWLEDTHFGHDAFSRPMTSSLCTLQQAVAHPDFSCDDSLTFLDQPLVRPMYGFSPFVVFVIPILVFPPCLSSLHLFMSLQQ